MLIRDQQKERSKTNIEITYWYKFTKVLKITIVKETINNICGRKELFPLFQDLVEWKKD